MRHVRRLAPLVLALGMVIVTGCAREERVASTQLSGEVTDTSTADFTAGPPAGSPSCEMDTDPLYWASKTVGPGRDSIYLPDGTRLDFAEVKDRPTGNYRLEERSPGRKFLLIRATPSGPVAGVRLTINYRRCGGPDTLVVQRFNGAAWDEFPRAGGTRPYAPVAELDHLSDYSIGTPRRMR